MRAREKKDPFSDILKESASRKCWKLLMCIHAELHAFEMPRSSYIHEFPWGSEQQALGGMHTARKRESCVHSRKKINFSLK